MSNTNNFKKLMEEDEADFAERSARVQNSLWQTLGVFKLMGEVVDIFLPKVFDVLIAAAGGKGDVPDQPAKDRGRPDIPSQGGIDSGRDLGPRKPDDIDEGRN